MRGAKGIRFSRGLLLLTAFLSLTLLGGLMERLEREIYGVKPGVYLEGTAVGNYLPHELMPLLEEKAALEQTLPLEPGIDKNGKILSGVEGVTMDVEATLERLLSAAPDQQISAVRVTTSPRHSVEELKGLEQDWGRYITWNRGSADRQANVRLACRAIDYTLLWPDQVFSFNQVVGPRTNQYGYHQAPVMVGDGFALGVGGGVCQVATTLYNAVRAANLPVLERHAHSGKVHYVPAGRDAAVAYDYMDLKFKNNRSGPLIVRCYTSGGQVVAVIRGR